MTTSFSGPLAAGAQPEASTAGLANLSSRILIVRLSAIGDVIHTMPMVGAIRRAMPAAYLAWAVEGRNGDLLEGYEGLDELIRLPRGWLKSPSRVWQTRRELRRRKFDVAIDAQGLSRSAIVAWLSGARTRIGLGDQFGRELSPWLNNALCRPRAAHAIERNLELLRPLGIRQAAVQYQMNICGSHRQALRQWRRQAGLGERFAVLNPGAGWQSKVWPPQRFAGVARALAKRCQLPSVITWAGAEERAMAESIAASSPRAHIAPPTSLGELAALLSAATLYVGGDTGPTHLAAALQVPCVGLMGPTPAERLGPYGERNISVQGQSSTDRYRPKSPHNDAMQSIAASQVVEACEQILARGAYEPASEAAA